MNIEKSMDDGKKRRRQPDIGLTDVFKALHFLSPTSERSKQAIVGALGFDWILPSSELSSSETIDSGDEQNPATTAAEAVEEEKEDNTEMTSPPAKLLEARQETEIELVDAFHADWGELSLLPETDVKNHLGKSRYVPLLNENWFRGIMSSLLATESPSPEIDFKQIEKSLLRLAPLERIPFRSRYTLERGVQILLDTSESMQPFWRDETELVAALKHLIDSHKVWVFEFEMKRLPRPYLTWQNRSMEGLQTAIPVLIVSNFGGAHKGIRKIGEFKPLAALLEHAKNKKCPLTALVPLTEEKFPSDLKDFVPFSFVWDRTSSPQIVSRIKRH